jgi:hypothetical protein
MGYSVYRCDECDALLLADGGAFLAHKKTKHNSRGYGRSKVVAVIENREKKYEFRDVPQEKREGWIKTNGILKPMKECKKAYVIS